MNRRRFLKMSAAGVLVAAAPSVTATGGSWAKRNLVLEEMIIYDRYRQEWLFHVKGPREKNGDYFEHCQLCWDNPDEDKDLLNSLRDIARIAMNKAYSN